MVAGFFLFPKQMGYPQLNGFGYYLATKKMLALLGVLTNACKKRGPSNASDKVTELSGEG